MPAPTTITINVDVLKSVNAIGQLNMEMGKTGTVAQQNAQKVTQSQAQMTGAIRQTGDQAAASAVKFQTMGQGMLNLSTAAVQTFTSFSNLDRAYNRNKMAAIGVERATDLLNRKQFKYNELLDKGLGNTSKAILLKNELSTATHDLAEKENKLKIETAAVLDVQLLFIANIANVGVSSLMIYKTMFDGVTLAQVKNKIVTIANTVATKLNNLSKWSFVPAGAAQRVSLMAGSGALATHTIATRVATMATKLLTIALGPVGWIIMGISAALVAYETNFYGFKDAINGFLGIQTKLNDEIEEGTGVLDLHSDAISGVSSALSKMPTDYQAATRELKKYREELEKFPKDIVIPSMTNLGKNESGVALNNTKIMIPKNSAHMVFGALAMRGLSNRSGGTNNAKEEMAIEKVSQLVINISVLTPEELERMDNLIGFTGPGGWIRAQEAIDLNKHISDILRVGLVDDRMNPFADKVSRGQAFLISDEIDKKLSAILGYDISSYSAGRMVQQINEGTYQGEIGRGQRAIAKYFRTDKGLDNKKLSISFSKLSNREFVKTVIGLDIGGVANVMDRNDAIRIAIIQKQLGAAGNGLVRTNDVGNSIRNQRIAEALVNNSYSQLQYNNNVRSYADQQIRDNGYGGGRIGTNFFGRGFYNSGGATAAYQVGRTADGNNGFKIDPIFAQIRKQSDAFANSGGVQAANFAMNLFGGTVGRGGSGASRSAGNNFARLFGDTILFKGNTSAFAKAFGQDQISSQEMSMAQQKFEDSQVNGIPTLRAAGDFLNRALGIADRRIDRVESFVSNGLGIDFDANPLMVKRQIYWGGRKGNQKFRWFSTMPSVGSQIRTDIGASAGIVIPSADKLEAITLAFNTNGNFTNFNNMNIEDKSTQGLNITEQRVFDIRFNHTRGDRELLNRLRFAEKLQAGSSGTSPL